MPAWILIILIVIASIAGFIILWLTLAKVVRKLIRFPAPAWTGWFLDSRFRRWMQPPERIITRSGIKPGMKVLEVGCGSGAYTTHVARAVGPSGHVYAVDIQPGMLSQFRKKLKKPDNSHLGNIELIEAGAYEMPLDAESADLIYMITVLPEIPQPAKALAECMRILKPSGILAVTEFFPDPDYPLKSTTVKRAERAGFVSDGIDGCFWNYTARFFKPENNRGL